MHGCRAVLSRNDLCRSFFFCATLLLGIVLHPNRRSCLLFIPPAAPAHSHRRSTTAATDGFDMLHEDAPSSSSAAAVSNSNIIDDDDEANSEWEEALLQLKDESALAPSEKLLATRRARARMPRAQLMIFAPRSQFHHSYNLQSILKHCGCKLERIDKAERVSCR